MTDEEWDTMNQFKNPKAAYGSCYAMGRVGDSIDEIYDALKEQAVIFKSAGGYGVSFSDLRSEGALVSTTMGESCGPLGFMDLFNMNTQKIALSGKTKRGANMFSMSVSHPDIEKFIARKSEMIEDSNGQIRPKYLEHVNTSVEISDEFMDTLFKNGDWNLIDPHTKQITKTVKAEYLWDLMIEMVYKSADPGVLMIDNMNKFNPLREYEKIESVNPCQEFQSISKTVCNLGSVNLYAMIGDNSIGEIDAFDKRRFILDFDKLSKTVRTAVIYLNLALMANDYPLDILTKRSLEYRPIGLGFMGLGSLFMRMGYEYGSEESIQLTRKIMDHFVLYTVRASNEFYHISGIKFKDYDKSEYAQGIFHFNNRYSKEISSLLKDGITNFRLNAIAPTGSISMLAAYLTSDAASVSGGVEPVFSLNYTRKVNPNTDQEFVIDQDDIAVRDTLKAMGHDKDTIRRVMNGDSKAKHITTDPGFNTAEKLSVDKHLAILEIVSNAIDMSVSKTINMPESTTKEEISDLYKKAYKLGLKGITIFRAGSRQAVLETKKKDKMREITFDLGIDFNDKGKIKPKERPTVIQALKKSVKFKVSEDDITRIMNIEVGFDDKNDPFEVFIRATTSTKEYSELFNAIGRLVSTSLRSNADITNILKQVKKIKNWKNEYSTICQIISSAVEELVELGKTKSAKKKQEAIDKINSAKLMTSPKGYLIDPETGDAYCPVCMSKQGEGLKFESGCISCACGWSACT
jgi:ribonucleoside-diphosphate reductase alpha chain